MARRLVRRARPLPPVSIEEPSEANVARAAEILARGGLVAFPTETVYGLGANALDAQACARIFEVKRRPHFDPLIVHVPSVEVAEALCTGFDARARALAEAFWPGPLTLVVPKAEIVPAIVTSGQTTVALRAPSHPVAIALLRAARVPIAAPSANLFGYISPTAAEHVDRQLGSQVPLILDGGPCELGLESTILDLTGERVELLRAGALEVERIESVIGQRLSAAPREARPKAPGQLERHYSPHTRFVLLDEPARAANTAARAGLLAFRAPGADVSATYRHVEILSPSGDLREAAARLFAALHRLDSADLDVIFAEPVPLDGLGLAIADRLRRAAARG